MEKGEPARGGWFSSGLPSGARLPLPKCRHPRGSSLGPDSVRALTVTAPAKPPEHNPGMTPTSSPRRRLRGLRRLAFELVRRPHCRRQGGSLSPSRARIRHPSHQGAAGSPRLVGFGTPPTRVQPGPALRWEGSRLLVGPSALPPIFPGCSPSRGRSGAPCAPSAPVPAVRSARSSPFPRRAQPFTGQPRPGEKGHAPRGIPPPVLVPAGPWTEGWAWWSCSGHGQGLLSRPDTTLLRASRGGVGGGERQPNSEGPVPSGAVRSVDCWPLARNSARFPGVNPTRYPLTSVDVDRAGVSSTRDAHAAVPPTPSRATRASAADRVLGNSVGAIGWSREPLLHRNRRPGAGPGSVLAPADSYFLPLQGWAAIALRARSGRQDSYLVDSASSHMLVSKIKPCMSKYKQSILWNCEWLIKSVIVYLIVPLPG
jgi:hypothetical protein